MSYDTKSARELCLAFFAMGSSLGGGEEALASFLAALDEVDRLREHNTVMSQTITDLFHAEKNQWLPMLAAAKADHARGFHAEPCALCETIAACEEAVRKRERRPVSK